MSCSDDWAEAMKRGNDPGHGAFCPPVPASAGITGYRPLTAGEVHWINLVKAKAQEVGYLLDEIRVHSSDVDHRWLAIGKTDLQQGFMAVIRAIARPETF